MFHGRKEIDILLRVGLMKRWKWGGRRRYWKVRVLYIPSRYPGHGNCLSRPGGGNTGTSQSACRVQIGLNPNAKRR